MASRMPPGLSDRCTLSAASASIYTAPTTCHWLYGAMRPAFLVCQAVACTCATQIDSGGARSRTAVTSVELAIQGGKLVHEQSIFRIAGLCTCMPHAARWQLERECVKCVCVVPPTVVRYSWFFTLGSAIGPRDLRSRSPIRRLPVVCLGGCKMCVCRGHGHGSHAADVKTTDPHVTENVQGIWLASSYLLPPSRTATVHGSSWPWGEGVI